MPSLSDSLSARCGNACELCGASDGLTAYVVAPDSRDAHIAVCATCAGRLAAPLDAKDWFCVQEAIWSEVPEVQVTAWRITKGLDAGWATELLEQAYLDEDVLAWAQDGMSDDDSDAPTPTVDSNGTALQTGDNVTLIKDLDVKGAGFTAKRGTLVKNVRLTDDPELVEGKVNKTSIYLKTCFLKKVG